MRQRLSISIMAALGLVFATAPGAAMPVTNVRQIIASPARAVPATEASARVGVDPQGGSGLYEVIVDRNPFGLRPVPPPAPAAEEDPAKEISALKLTGITVLKSVRRAMFVLETPGRPIVDSGLLSEGERDGFITNLEVLRIDAKAGVVRVRLGAKEFTLNFAENGIKPPTSTGAKPPVGAPASAPNLAPSRATRAIQRAAVLPNRS